MTSLMARRILPSLLVAFAIACSGGSDNPNDTDNGNNNSDPINQAPTAQRILENCVAFDAADLASLMEMLQATMTGGEGAPEISIDLVGGVLGGGVFPYGVDMDLDGTDDITGTIHFTNAAGTTTIPFDTSDLGSLDPSNPLGLLAAIQDGTTLHMSFAFDSLLLESGNGASGEGEFRMLIDSGMIASTDGEATFGSGACAFDVNFEDLALGEFVEGTFPDAMFEFNLDAVEGEVAGKIEFDGTSKVKVTASIDGGAEETFTIDLLDGGLTG